MNRDCIRVGRAQDVLADIEMHEERIATIRAILTRTTQRLTGMPGGGGNHDSMPNLLIKLDEQYRMEERALRRYLHESGEEAALLADCADDTMRTFVKLAYIERRPKQDIASRLRISKYYVEKICDAIESAPCFRSVNWGQFDRIFHGGNDSED